MLPDAAAEHDGVGAAQDCQVRAEVLAGAVTEHLDGQARARILALAREQVPHVGAPARESAQPGPLVEPPLGLRDRHAFRADEVSDEGGIDVSRPGAHHEALERGEAHRRVHRAPALDRGRRAAVPEMEGHEVRPLRRVPDMRAYSSSTERYARPWKP